MARPRSAAYAPQGASACNGPAGGAPIRPADDGVSSGAPRSTTSRWCLPRWTRASLGCQRCRGFSKVYVAFLGIRCDRDTGGRQFEKMWGFWRGTLLCRTRPLLCRTRPLMCRTRPREPPLVSHPNTALPNLRVHSYTIQHIARLSMVPGAIHLSIRCVGCRCAASAFPCPR